MAKITTTATANPFGKILSFLAWLVGIIVSLAVGYGMKNDVLSLPSWLGGSLVAMVAGWIVIILTFLGVVMAIAKHVR